MNPPTQIAIALAAVAVAIVYLARKVSQMSNPEFEKLKADVAEALKELAAKNAANAALTADKASLEADKAAQTAQIADLQAQLAAAQAAAGVPVADVVALDAELASGLDPAPTA